MNNTYTLWENLRRITKDIFKQILLIIFYILLSLGIQYIFIKPLYNINLVTLNIVSILTELIVLTTFILLFRKRLIPDFDDFKKHGNSYMSKFFIYYIIGLFIMIISNVLISMYVGTATNEELNRSILTKLPIYSIFAMVIVAPITEECLTRTILKDTFKHPIFYYMLSALIFGGLHLISSNSLAECLYIIPYGSLGFIFAMMYKKSGNIWTNITFHAMHNLIAILIIFRGL